MGMFDYAKVSGESFRCSEGHDLSGEEFQTKDLGCTMGTAHIDEDGSFVFEDGGYGAEFPANFSGEVEVYGGCPECPAFVQAGTLNLCDRSVAFVVHIMAGTVEKVTRQGGTLAEWIAEEQAQSFMAGALGPIPRAEAYAIHCRRVPIPAALAESVRLREEEWKKRDAERRAEEAAPELAIQSRIAAAVAEERERWEARDRLFFAKLSAAGISHGATAEGIIEAFNSGLVVAAVAEEREAIAKEVEGAQDPDQQHKGDVWLRARLAAAIRARGGKS